MCKGVKESLKNSIDKIKKENYENYFIYTYNKKSYKDNEKKVKSHQNIENLKFIKPAFKIRNALNI